MGAVVEALIALLEHSAGGAQAPQEEWSCIRVPVPEGHTKTFRE